MLLGGGGIATEDVIFRVILSKAFAQAYVMPSEYLIIF
jgi:hypothetical protein